MIQLFFNMSIVFQHVKTDINGMRIKSLKFGGDKLLRRMLIFIRITGSWKNRPTGYFGVFDGMAIGVEMCGYRSAREIGSGGSEMIGEACWQSCFGLTNNCTASGRGTQREFLPNICSSTRLFLAGSGSWTNSKS